MAVVDDVARGSAAFFDAYSHRPMHDDEPIVRLPVEDAIDLHAFAPRDVLSVVDEYLYTAQAEGFRQVRLIHGRGAGVQRAAVQRLLCEHPAVQGFFDAPEARLGATVARLKPPTA